MGHPFALLTASQADLEDDDIADQLFHVEFGVILTYRFTRGWMAEQFIRGAISTASGNDTLRQTRSIVFLHIESCLPSSMLVRSLAENQKFFNRASDVQASEAVHKPCTLILVPGFFMAQNTITEAFMSITATHPFSTLLTIGLPGMPHTHWPKGRALTPSAYSNWIQILLRYLRSRDLIRLQKGEPVLVVGADIGGYVGSLSWCRVC
jgi:hypothetical protein